MRRIGIFIVLSSVILAAPIVAERLEEALSADAAVVFSVNGLSQHVQKLSESKIFPILEALHHLDKPQEPTLSESVEKIKGHVLFRIFQHRFVLGIVPPQGESAPQVEIIGIGPKLGTAVQELFQEERQKQKMYPLDPEMYEGVPVQVFLHSEKNALVKKYFLVDENCIVFSTHIDRAKKCYDRVNGKTDDGRRMPASYEKIDAAALFKAHVNVAALHLDLDKKNPLEKKFPATAEFFANLRKLIGDTDKLTGYIAFSEGDMTAEISREYKDGGKLSIPALPLPQNLVDEKTIAMAYFPVPYRLFWYIAKTKAERKDPRRWRQMESSLDQMFEWAGFEEEILPQIGPHTLALLQLPRSAEKQPALPYLTIGLGIGPKLELASAMKKLWEWLLKNPKIAKHVQLQPQDDKNSILVHTKLKNTPLDKLVDPLQIIVPGKFLVGSDSVECKRVLQAIDNPKEMKSMLAYVGFSALAELLRMNEDFLRKEAQKKNSDLPLEKLELLHGLLSKLGNASLFLQQGEYEALRLEWKANNE